MRWNRLLSLIATALIGIAGACLIWSFNDAPRWTIAVSGLLAAAGVAAALVLLIILVAVIVEDVRPSVRFRKPVVPLSLAHREAALIGRTRFRLHPVTFWGVLTLNHRFVFGFMVCDKPEYVEFKTDEAV